MHVIKKRYVQSLSLLLLTTACLASVPASAATDTESQENFLRARVMSHQKDAEHAGHANPLDKSQEFHGVFYGFLPCDDCNGIKTTLSLKQNHHYLLVTQPARESSREFYEKGKYEWNDDTRTVVLTPRDKAPAHQYAIEEEGTLVQMNADGSRMSGKQAESYTLRRSDTVKSREVHIH